MDKKEANGYLAGAALGWLFFRKKGKTEEKSGGFFSTVIYILAIIVCFSQGWIIAGLILLSPTLIGLLIGIVTFLISQAETKKRTEITDLDSAFYFYLDEKYDECFALCNKYPENVDSISLLGLFYLNGIIVEKDIQKALSNFNIGKEKNVLAANCYGEMLVAGLGIDKNVEEGNKWIQKAVKEGFVKAGYFLSLAN